MGSGLSSPVNKLKDSDYDRSNTALSTLPSHNNHIILSCNNYKSSCLESSDSRNDIFPSKHQNENIFDNSYNEKPTNNIYFPDVSDLRIKELKLIKEDPTNLNRESVDLVDKNIKNEIFDRKILKLELNVETYDSDIEDDPSSVMKSYSADSPASIVGISSKYDSDVLCFSQNCYHQKSNHSHLCTLCDKEFLTKTMFNEHILYSKIHHISALKKVFDEKQKRKRKNQDQIKRSGNSI